MWLCNATHCIVCVLSVRLVFCRSVSVILSVSLCVSVSVSVFLAISRPRVCQETPQFTRLSRPAFSRCHPTSGQRRSRFGRRLNRLIEQTPISWPSGPQVCRGHPPSQLGRTAPLRVVELELAGNTFSICLAPPSEQIGGTRAGNRNATIQESERSFMRRGRRQR